MRHAHGLLIGLVAAALLTGCKETSMSSGNSETSIASLTVPSGTPLEVTLQTTLSSEEARVGTTWSGTIASGANGIPSGASVTGTVSSVKPARQGDRAMLDLELTSVNMNGENYAVTGETEAVVAGSTRARNLGAIAGGAAAGALIGKAVSGSKKGTLVGGVLGGAAATGIVARSQGYQVVLKPGMTLTFRTTESVRVRA